MATGHGWFGNHRTLKEQMLGLAPALAEVKGKTVLDAGTAEGNIALEFVLAGAARVDAFDNNPGYVCEAQNKAWGRQLPRGVMRVKEGDINLGLPDGFGPRYDIVLALAIIHKAADVIATTRILAEACAGLMVIRLPLGSDGAFKAKYGGTTCDLRVELPELGLSLERTEPGPREELVQYWRRT